MMDGQEDGDESPGGEKHGRKEKRVCASVPLERGSPQEGGTVQDRKPAPKRSMMILFC
jgi:hypothetical protein